MNADSPLVKVFVESVHEKCGLKWAEGMSFNLPEPLLIKSGLRESIDVRGLLRLSDNVSSVTVSDAAELRLRRAFTPRPPLSSRLPISYQKFPPKVRSLIASTVGRLRRGRADRWAAFPAWPLDLSADFLADMADSASSPFRNGPTPVVLTHDLDSAEGLTNLTRWFLAEEEAVGARSVSYVVPRKWPVDYSQLDEVKQRGHELGIHGYDHSNRTPYVEARQRAQRLNAAMDLIERYEIIGYRSPSLLRTRELLHDLGRYYRYDSSIPAAGGMFPVPNNGCASARPFEVEGIIEIPITMPRDGSLLFLGYHPDKILDMWISCAEHIARSGGIVMLLTHCEARFSGNKTMLSVYRRFLEHVASSSKYEWNTPSHVLTKFFHRERIGVQEG